MSASSFASNSFQILIIDEAARLREKSVTATELAKCAKTAKQIILLTGTPLSTHFTDLLYLLVFCLPEFFNRKWMDFKELQQCSKGFIRKYKELYEDDLKTVVCRHTKRYSMKIS